MKKSYSFLGSISNGKLILHNENLFKEEIRKLNEIGLLELTITLHKEKRSNEQNSLYWGAIVSSIKHEIEKSTGENYSLQKTHEFLKNKFCTDEIYNSNTDEFYDVPFNTSELNTGQFYEYMEKCKQFALNFFGLDIEKIIREYEKK